ncbi:hypothetical protein [Pontibacter pudoricolor]|uniref:hypothetical protein n=1 Tax=Pontibacter pudoricolor TaxID=2694930 RepID=UPI0013908B21|nr:hypothetical protein [Pontibacter pudoricolor]
MQEIEQLINVLQVISSKNIQSFFSHKSKSLEGEFIENVTQGNFKTDTEAAYKLYGTDQSDVRFKMLKHRVKKKLHNALITADITTGRLPLRREVECEKLLLLSKILLKQKEFSIVLGLCKKIKTLALEFEFNDLVLNALEIELECLTSQGGLKLYKNSRDEFLKYSEIVSLEKEAASLFQLSMVHLKSTVKNRKLYLGELPNLITRLRTIWDETKTFSCFYYFYRTSMLFYELIGNFGEIIKITEEAESLVRANKINAQRFETNLNAYMLIYAHLRTKEFSNGLKYASDFYNLFDSNTKNWFAYMENYFLLAVHAKNYELASVLLHRVRSNTSYNIITKAAAERWQLYTAYLYFIDSSYSILEGFNYQKFITSITEYSKDKQGFNVAILILQFLYFLQKGDTEGLLYRIESLKKYILTHLKDSFSLRSKLFLKLLMLTVTENYDAASCRLKGAKHYQKLIETPAPGDAYAEIEIVPYEHLWELILDAMPA